MKPKSRKEEYAEMTRQALLDAALHLFIQKGYHKTSIEDIVQKARVTRGALYHHFKNKEAIFVRVYIGIVAQLVDAIESSLIDMSDPWQKALAGCKAYLDYCIDPRYKTIRLDDAIGVLGWRRWREIDSSYTMKILKDILSEIQDTGQLAISSLDVTANMIYALLVEGALIIGASKNRQRAHKMVLANIQKMLMGLKL